jgi:hypothetical protein
MPAIVGCPACGKKYQAPDTLAGKSVRCGCGTAIKVPSLASEPMASVSVPSIFEDATEADFNGL